MSVKRRFGNRFAFLSSLVIATVLSPAFQAPAVAQYQVFNLVSNQTGKALHTDPNLVNAWGIAYFPGAPFWVSDNGTGKSTLYDGMGNPQPLVVVIPPASGTGNGTPTGMVANSTTDFVITGGGGTGPAAFIFDTSDGTISGWNGGTDAVITVNNSSLKSNYTGLAMGFNNGKNFLFAADDGPNSRVDIFDATFKPAGSFTDKTLPAGFAPYNVQNINGYLWVAFGKLGMPGGFVDIFDTAGHGIKRFASMGKLNGPWGLALAPPNFGKFSSALLVGNLNDGTINAFDYTSGVFLGQLTDTTGKVISIDGLWGLTFGGSSTADGQTNQLFFSAGPNGYANGLFGGIVAH